VSDRDEILSGAIVAHTLVAAHADRVQALARLWDSLERAVANGGVQVDVTRDAHQHLCAQVDSWMVADLEAERRDMVALAEDERARMRRDTARAIAHAEVEARGLLPTAREHGIVHALQQIHDSFPVALPRATLVRFRRSAARLARIEALDGPAFLLGGEAGVMLGAFELATVPLAPADFAFNPSDGFHGRLIWGLRACVVREPGATGGVDLGLGASTAVAELLGIGGEDLDELYNDWLETAEVSHPFARYPFVARGRLCRVSPTRLVRADLESTGPVGWADDDDVARLGDALLAIGEERGAIARELGAASRRVHAAAERGHAVIGLIEYLPREAEGQRNWLSESDGSDDAL
jgi:hypothetical protein